MPEGLDYCYHTHTKRCGHAYGEDEEYVLRAIANGFKVMGFSDHVMFEDLVQKGMRGSGKEMIQDYFSSIRSLQRKYADKIEMHLGYEAEWLGDEIGSYYRSLLEKGEIEYLIMGQHCYLHEGKFLRYAKIPDRLEGLRRYKEDLIEGMRSGLFSYVCHPDLFVQWYPNKDEHFIEVSKEICQASLDLDIPLEINMGPSREGDKDDFERPQGLSYPSDYFWEIVDGYGCKVVIGVDAHAPEHFDQAKYSWALGFAKKHHANLVKRINFPKFK